MASQPARADDTQNGYRVVLAYVVLGAVLLFASKSRVGATLLYYALVLMLFFLIVTQFQFFQFALAPFQQAGTWLAGKSASTPTTPAPVPAPGASDGGTSAGGSF